ncbi:UDP-4-amino-4,6-dideoxy-N-acetyl-beta-L-altrosamine transaminase [Pontivivens insulae]|uniref:UDP-4-amino-4-deoxy-L-arabinose--oxoglutarate aminotransferase n=1 Tax=Pontivivens insulae TaxID=1639689 RepID=A0A2R8A7J4_9RHOB|nr:UDP-4-amino-4,6-dideoxy-N-acetyl-beta-L-altrosamine transaminase [Pontivivens insulae]RED18274.1 UDP-4-amino-4,6-dideoxy-N-acetyl-beta-L-altrosamine transaminase [Pontivivens insulae]SPF28172.1 UDP-4-amino-4-deoxy-L-arabinose--oxoglutarate aminotransferase [Pontivivens insulae]
MIPYGRQSIDEQDVAAVTAVLKSDFLTQGPQVPKFEKAVADYVGAAHGIAVNSATSALHIACMALGLGAGDRLWTVPITFVASSNVGLYCGASVDFVDIDAQTLTMCPKALEAKLSAAASSGSLPKVLVPVHLTGRSCDMIRISALAREYGVHIIEDASHAIGATYDGSPVGDCRYSDITVFSFHPVKIITTAEGGLATTQDAALASAMELARSHGVTRDPALMTGPSEGGWYYQQVAMGYNYRMTDLQAALGVAQMERLDALVARRRDLAQWYHTALANLPLTLPTFESDATSAWHLYVVGLNDPSQRRNKADLFDRLRARGIGVNLHYIPVHLQPYYRTLGFNPGDFPISEAYYEAALTLPLHPGLSQDDLNTVVRVLSEELAD